MNKLKSVYDKLAQAHCTAWRRTIESSYLSDGQLQFCRWFLPALYLLFYMPDYNWIADLPDAWFDPPQLSIAVFFGAFPPLIFLQISQTALVLCLGALMAGYKPRLSGLCFCFLHILITSFEYSVGKIDHVAHLFILCFFCFSLGNWGTKLPEKSFKLPIPCSTLLAITLAFGMFTAGFEKAIRWIDFNSNTSGFLSWYFSGYFNLDRNLLAAPYINQLPKIMLEFLDYSAVAFELSPLICLLIGKRFWTAWCIVACMFHAGTTAMLNISFPYQLFGYLPFLLPAILHKRQRMSQRLAIVSIIGLLIIRLTPIWSDYPFLLRTLLLPNQLILLIFDLLVWLSLAGLGIFSIYKFTTSNIGIKAPHS